MTAADVGDAAAALVHWSPRLWFVGSRLRPGDETLIWQALVTHGRITREEERVNAKLLLVER